MRFVRRLCGGDDVRILRLLKLRRFVVTFCGFSRSQSCYAVPKGYVCPESGRAGLAAALVRFKIGEGKRCQTKVKAAYAASALKSIR
jgi:hypothetical protein